MYKETFALQEMVVDNATQRTMTVLGGKGSGKTTLLKMFLKNSSSPCLVFDPLNVIKSKDIEAYRITISKATKDEQIKKIGLASSVLLKGGKNVVIAFIDMLQEEESEIVDKLLPLINFKDGFIVVDEIHEFTPNFGGSKEMERFIRHCRNKNIGVIMTSQRPASVKKNVLALTDYLVLFRVTWTHDLKAVEDLLKDIIGRERVKEMLKRLARFEFMEGYVVDYRKEEGNNERDTTETPERPDKRAPGHVTPDSKNDGQAGEIGNIGDLKERG